MPAPEAAVAFDDRQRGGKAEAGAAADLLGGEKGIEDLFHHRGGHAGARLKDRPFAWLMQSLHCDLRENTRFPKSPALHCIMQC